MKSTRVVGVVLAVMAAGCASSYPVRAPARPEVQLAVLQYQLDEQVHGKFRAVVIGVEEQPKTYSPYPVVMASLKDRQIPVYAYASLSQMPNVPEEELLYLGVDARPERVYPDEVVILGQYGLGLSESGSYRYFVRPEGASWRVAGAEPVEFDTDCYGFRWIKPKS